MRSCHISGSHWNKIPVDHVIRFIWYVVSVVCVCVRVQYDRSLHRFGRSVVLCCFFHLFIYLFGTLYRRCTHTHAHTICTVLYTSIHPSIGICWLLLLLLNCIFLLVLRLTCAVLCSLPVYLWLNLFIILSRLPISFLLCMLMPLSCQWTKVCRIKSTETLKHHTFAHTHTKMKHNLHKSACNSIINSHLTSK